MSVAKTASLYTQLTRNGNELRGCCPFCSADKFIVFNKSNEIAEFWACLNCGLHELWGGTIDALNKLATEHNLIKRTKPFKIRKEPLKTIRWARCLPPKGSTPDYSGEWLGDTLSVKPEFDAAGRLRGYLAVHSKVGLRHWIYIRWSDADPGCWKCRRPSIYDRVNRQYPDIRDAVAKQIVGRSKVTVPELTGCENPKGYKAKAVAFALRQLGWVKHRNHAVRYYVPPQNQQEPQNDVLNNQ